MNEETPTYKRWRESFEKFMRQGAALEKIAAAHPEIPFEVDPIANELWWAEFYENIQMFSERVQRIANIFGPPTRVKVTPHGENKEKAPDMHARWDDNDGRPNIILRSYHPECRIHPESEYVAAVHIPAKYPDLHPECADVLKELEDYEPEPEKAECAP